MWEPDFPMRLANLKRIVEDRPQAAIDSPDMAYNQGLADDIRSRIGNHPDLTEKEMFGGIAFMIGGNMAVGVSGDELMVRVGKEAHDQAVAKPGARIFDLSARPMRGWVVVAPEGLDTDAALDAWIDQGVAYAESLPSK